MQGNKKYISVLILSLVILLIVGFLVYFFHWGKGFGSHQVLIPKTEIRILSTDSLPATFPTGLFMEQDAHIVSSYTNKNPDGKEQSTIIYTTKSDQSKVHQDYAQYLYNDGWDIHKGFGFNGENASKGDVKIMVSASVQNTDSTTTTVSINLIK